MKNVRQKFILILVLVGLQVIVQAIFFYIQTGQAKSAIKTIEGLLREEITQSNPYSIARSVNDFERVQLLKCSKLTIDKNYVYIDLSFRQECHFNSLLLDGIKIRTSINGLSGSEYQLEFISVNPSTFYLALWITRILIFSIVICFFIIYRTVLTKNLKILEIERNHIKALVDITKQVAHDIRSPLTSLEMATKNIDNLPERTRIIIRGAVGQVRDIANNLLEKHRVDTDLNQSNKVRSTLISSIVEESVSLKRMQNRGDLDVQIEYSLDSSSYGLFAEIDPIELKRVLSNLMNNAIEAFEGKGILSVYVKQMLKENLIKIVIEDNGKGIPSEIIQKLTMKGYSYGKKDGNGLGLAHARETIENYNGHLEINSILGKGTTVEIILPKALAPAWFVPEVDLNNVKTVLCLDDDFTIHQVWEQRFSDIDISGMGIKVDHFSDPKNFRNWLSCQENLEGILFLCDYEFLGHQENGLDIIESCGIGKQSILITSRYDEFELKLRCQKHNIKVIPKDLAIIVPIKAPILQSSMLNVEQSNVTHLYDKVLIDDDLYIRWNWEDTAKKKMINFISFPSPTEFFQSSHLIAKNAAIYIDRDLGDHHIKGEFLAKEIFEKGFGNIYLATGYDKEQFANISWIKGVSGKIPPWFEEEESW